MWIIHFTLALILNNIHHVGHINLSNIIKKK